MVRFVDGVYEGNDGDKKDRERYLNQIVVVVQSVLLFIKVVKIIGEIGLGDREWEEFKVLLGYIRLVLLLDI